MSSNLKLRAWDKFNECFYFSEKASSFQAFFDNFQMLSGNGMVLEMYSTINDSDGVEIYAGDIVEYELDNMEPESGTTKYREEVKFIDGCFCVDGYTPLYATTEWKLKRVGNIHEHPHLLCDRCKGTQLVSRTFHTENGDFDADNQPCPECTQ